MTPRLTKLVSVLAVRDHRASAAYYRDVLGFTIVHEDDDWIFLERDAARIHLGNCPDVIHASEIGYHNAFATILVENLDALEAEFHAKGALFRQPIMEKEEWRDFVITTPDGHVIVFGQLPDPPTS